ncbi:uncharacterized protein LOC62_05G007394 [Vanrija pseudolonga]|uniref:Uncharacterized protein n=1 Tax=Vanrija pseudolonga TaxID=143232 RepID=A0AAF0YH90_9TREE|nr:hypothetical protein LOC62_05G007394 [Vanrija pseudolonga]
MSTATAATSTAPDPAQTSVWWGGNTNVGVGGNSTMYIFTFLATIIVLSLIGLALVFRAMIIRRRLHRRIEEAIARGEVIPYSNPFLPTPAAPKKPAPVQPLPTLWESEMRLDGDDWEGYVIDEEKWDFVTPVGLYTVHPPIVEEEEKPRMPLQVPSLWSELGEAFREMLPTRRLARRRRRSSATTAAAAAAPVTEFRPTLQEAEVRDAPGPMQEALVGVLIALPFQHAQAELWRPLHADDVEVPDVCLGVMEVVTVEGEKAVSESVPPSRWASRVSEV